MKNTFNTMSNTMSNTMFNTLIIIVDEDLIFSQKLLKNLSSNGFKNIKIINSISRAKNILLLEEPSLIIMEHIFNNGTSEEIVNYIKINNLKTNWIVLSSNTNDAIISFKSIADGALSFVRKTDSDWKSMISKSVFAWINYFMQKETRIDRYRKIIM